MHAIDRMWETNPGFGTQHTIQQFQIEYLRTLIILRVKTCKRFQNRRLLTVLWTRSLFLFLQNDQNTWSTEKNQAFPGILIYYPGTFLYNSEKKYKESIKKFWSSLLDPTDKFFQNSLFYPLGAIFVLQDYLISCHSYYWNNADN